MYSLTIHFGPNAMCWSFLFKEKETAASSFMRASQQIDSATHLSICDDFGQEGTFGYASVHGSLLEDLALVEEARISRSLYNARGEVKARQRAMTDPVIRTAGQGPAVLQPQFGRQ